MLEFWQQRYSEEGYAYGDRPNVFFKQVLDGLEPGKILLPAEGEGRNSVYAALKGWQVDAYDFSEQAVEKALEFADKHQVSINYIQSSHSELMNRFKQDYDAIALIYAHVPNDIRESFHRQLLTLLKPGGYFMMEAFTTEQITRSSGGPKDINMLYTLDQVRSDFEKLCQLNLLEAVTEVLDEGKYHVGEAHFIRMLAVKK
ncbi:MAG: class I SAM-dependent methyltransferase [Gammaproteobacteria bacterium]|nr:class I SAM-dependent methyltransferase [Gammaproteobacteria bacterium]